MLSLIDQPFLGAVNYQVNTITKHSAPCWCGGFCNGFLILGLATHEHDIERSALQLRPGGGSLIVHILIIHLASQTKDGAVWVTGGAYMRLRTAEKIQIRKLQISIVPNVL